MCSQYTIRSNILEVTEPFTLPKLNFTDEFISGRYTISQKAPVITSRGIQMYTFSLIPRWSKERKVKFATHNARLFGEDNKPIYNKPTWREPFSENHCIVPISGFIEPIYTGEFAGNMVSFSGEKILYAAGIFDTWLDKETGELIESFAILTDDPVKFIASVGHDRTPVFISPQAANEWLSLKLDPDKQIEFLRRNRAEPKKWNVTIDRQMKPGWEKRIPS